MRKSHRAVLRQVALPVRRGRPSSRKSPITRIRIIIITIRETARRSRESAMARNRTLAHPHLVEEIRTKIRKPIRRVHLPLHRALLLIKRKRVHPRNLSLEIRPKIEVGLLVSQYKRKRRRSPLLQAAAAVALHPHQALIVMVLLRPQVLALLQKMT
jgi:hypothetical protein